MYFYSTPVAAFVVLLPIFLARIANAATMSQRRWGCRRNRSVPPLHANPLNPQWRTAAPIIWTALRRNGCGCSLAKEQEFYGNRGRYDVCRVTPIQCLSSRGSCWQMVPRWWLLRPRLKPLQANQWPEAQAGRAPRLVNSFRRSDCSPTTPGASPCSPAQCGPRRRRPPRTCMLVLIGATPEGKKELVGFQVGVRESA